MKKWKTTVGVGVLVLATAGVVKFALFSGQQFKKTEYAVQQNVEDTSADVKEHLGKIRKAPKNFVVVTFLSTNPKDEEVYKFIKRPYNKKAGSKLEVAVKDLLKGPNFKEQSKNIYSEVPGGVKLISVEESSDKVVINLNDAFENGGGTNSIYKRLYQLIKTVNRNTTKPVYLNINGKQVDVVGGDGIMITQPLSDKSLDD